MGNTVKLHRVYKCPAERLYRAFLDPRAQVKWFPPNGYVAEMHSSDVRVGGSYRMSFTNLATGESQAFGGTYREMKPNELIRYTDKFEDPGLPGEMSVTVRLREVMGGTDVEITQENVPSQIPVEMCYMGWQQSLELLGRLVE